MQAAIYFQILSDTSYTYQKPPLDALKHQYPDLVIYDFDTQSDRLVAGYATDLLEKADKAIIIIESGNGPTTGLVTLLEKVIACQPKCLVLLYGQHDLVERMTKLMDKDKLIQADQDDSAIQQVIKFLSAEQP